MIGRRLLFILTVVAGVLVIADRDAMAQPKYPPAQLKAVWLSYLGRYATWPANAIPGAGNKFVIGVLGPNPFGKFIEGIKRKPIQGKPVVVRYFDSTKNYTPCHILFVSPQPSAQAARQRLKDAIQVIRDKGDLPTLLVSDTAGLARTGSMVNYSIGNDGRLFLEINKGEAEGKKIKFSAALLNLKIVRLVNRQAGR